MHGLAVVNPRASAYDRATVERCLRTLGAALDLEVVETTHRGHAEELVGQARTEHLDAVVVVGGDGTVNEALSGLVERCGERGPVVAVLPFGLVNVFSRQLGLSRIAEKAAGELADRLRAGGTRRIGLGHVAARLGDASAGERWFALSVSIGFDAAAVAAVEARRAGSKPASTLLYARCAVAQFFRGRPHPRVQLTVGGVPGEVAEEVIVGNNAPWTYAGARPIWATPLAHWERGLDVMTIERLTVATTLRQLARMVRTRPPVPRNGAGVRHHHDLPALDVTASTPACWQVDGDARPAATAWSITAHPNAVSIPWPTG
jgi:diacylglycerol kinase family enzyme